MTYLRKLNSVSFFLLFINSLASASPHARRIPLLSISLEGYAPFANSHSYLDAGVQEQGGSCTFVDARSDSRSFGKPWAPLDFYSNIVSEADQRANTATLGEPDIYFQGDNNNRGGASLEASWTASVPNYLLDSIDFKQIRRAGDQALYSLSFTRGNLRYQGKVSVRTFVSGNDCTAAILICDGNENCPRQVTQIIATADTTGGLGDRFRRIHRERDRHDIASLEAIFSDGNREMLVKK